MVGRTQTEAVKSYQSHIQDALSCFAKGRLSATSYKESEPGILTFNSGRPSAFKGPNQLSFVCTQNYQIVPVEVGGRWKVHTTKYIYRLIGKGDKGIVDYHWHPKETPDKPFPHLHVTEYGSGYHHPTGRVLIEDLLILAVEYGAIPLDEKKWEKIVKKNVEDFAKGATWGIPNL